MKLVNPVCYSYLITCLFINKRVVFVFFLSWQHVEGFLLFLCNSCLAFQTTHSVHVSGPKIPVHFQQAVFPANQTVNIIHLSNN